VAIHQAGDYNPTLGIDLLIGTRPLGFGNRFDLAIRNQNVHADEFAIAQYSRIRYQGGGQG
jgi:hypothetical protein